MSYLDLFQRYGSPSDDATVDLRGYFRKPDQLDNIESVKLEDQSANRIIQEAEEMVERLRDYRRALAARYAQLETMPYHFRLELERRRTYDNRITYTLRMIRVYEDGTEAREFFETFPGKQRRDAIARYEELKRQNPGIEAVKDIERSAWEKR